MAAPPTKLSDDKVWKALGHVSPFFRTPEGRAMLAGDNRPDEQQQQVPQQQQRLAPQQLRQQVLQQLQVSEEEIREQPKVQLELHGDHYEERPVPQQQQQQPRQPGMQFQQMLHQQLQQQQPQYPQMPQWQVWQQVQPVQYQQQPGLPQHQVPHQQQPGTQQLQAQCPHHVLQHQQHPQQQVLYQHQPGMYQRQVQYPQPPPPGPYQQQVPQQQVLYQQQQQPGMQQPQGSQQQQAHQPKYQQHGQNVPQQDTGAILQRLYYDLQIMQQAFSDFTIARSPPPRMYSAGTCPFSMAKTFGVLRNGEFYYYEYSPGKKNFVPHPCDHCQPEMLEEYLDPLYSEYDTEIRKPVIFVGNMMSMQVEQYVYDFQQDLLVQVDRPNLIFDDDKCVTGTHLIALIKSPDEKETLLFERTDDGGLIKWKLKGDSLEVLAETRLVLLADPKKEETSSATTPFCDYEPSRMEQAYFNQLPPFTHHPCRGDGVIECIKAFDYVRWKYISFQHKLNQNNVYEIAEHTCDFCTPNVAQESVLHPKYAEEHHGRVVFHMYNTFYLAMEQYVYDPVTLGFEQVFYPELKYDVNKNSDGIVVYSGEFNGVPTVILKGAQGSVYKEHYSVTRKKYIIIPPSPVLTFFIRREQGRSAPEPSKSPDIIHLGFKNPLADENGVVPESALPFARIWSRIFERARQERTTSGCGESTSASSSSSTVTPSMANSGPPEVAEKLTKNQKKKLKKKNKKEREKEASGEAK